MSQASAVGGGLAILTIPVSQTRQSQKGQHGKIWELPRPRNSVAQPQSRRRILARNMPSATELSGS